MRFDELIRTHANPFACGGSQQAKSCPGYKTSVKTKDDKKQNSSKKESR